MKIEKAYQLAKENGYRGQVYSESVILLDKEFWVSLGRAMGWNGDGPFGSTFEILVNGKPKWKHEWHRCIDTLSEGKSADDFFKEL